MALFRGLVVKSAEELVRLEAEYDVKIDVEDIKKNAREAMQT